MTRHWRVMIVLVAAVGDLIPPDAQLGARLVAGEHPGYLENSVTEGYEHCCDNQCGYEVHFLSPFCCVFGLVFNDGGL